MVQIHRPVRCWRTAWLWPSCSCGRWRHCPEPWEPPGYRLPDGDRVPWPVNLPRLADEPTVVALPQRPLLTRAGRWRANRGRP